MLFLKFGAEVLNNVKGFLAANPDEKVKAMADEIDKLVASIQSSKTAAPSQLEKVKYELERLQQIGKDKIAPLEGLVFRFKDKVYKLTGTFAPINQLLGIIKFGK